MLKTTKSLDKPASSRNNGSRPASKWNDSNGEVDGFGVGENDMEHAKKSEKLFKSGKSKSEKTFKPQNLAKSGKSCQKVGIQLILTLWRLDQSS